MMTTVSVALPGGLEDFARVSQKIDEEELKIEEEEKKFVDSFFLLFLLSS